MKGDMDKAHKMVSMKRPKKKMSDTPEMAMPMMEEYGYGLQIRLENFELDKLGMELPKVGKEFQIVAVGKVTSVYESKSHHNEGDRGVQIQITELSLGNK